MLPAAEFVYFEVTLWLFSLLDLKQRVRWGWFWNIKQKMSEVCWPEAFLRLWANLTFTSGPFKPNSPPGWSTPSRRRWWTSHCYAKITKIPEDDVRSHTTIWLWFLFLFPSINSTVLSSACGVYLIPPNGKLHWTVSEETLQKTRISRRIWAVGVLIPRTCGERGLSGVVVCQVSVNMHDDELCSGQL